MSGEYSPHPPAPSPVIRERGSERQRAGGEGRPHAALAAVIFSPIIFAAEDKDRAYADALRDMSLLPSQAAIVDDRARRGIRWGNRHGALTIWFRNGKFADELPDDDTGPPAHIIARLAELGGVL